MLTYAMFRIRPKTLSRMGVDAYQTHQTSRTTFSVALCAAPVTILSQDMALSLGQASTRHPCRCRPKKNQIIPTIRYRPSVKCRPFTGCRTLLSAAPRLIAQYNQHYHRLVAGGNVFSHVCRPFRVPPHGTGSHQKYSHIDAAECSGIKRSCWKDARFSKSFTFFTGRQ